MRWARARWRAWMPYVVYGVLSLAVLGPLLAPGYILTLDSVFAPSMDYSAHLYGLDEGISAGAPLFLLLQGITSVFPAWLVQKAILLLAFFLCGVGAHRLAPCGAWGRYFAGVLYMVNPFTYVRFLAGQWMLLLAYAVVPFAVKAFLDLVSEGGARNAVRVAAWATLAGLLQVHFLLLLLVVFSVIFVARVAHRGGRASVARAARTGAIGAVVFLGLNVYWLVPLVTASGTALGYIGWEDLAFFSPRSSSALGVTFDTASMYGFWREGYIHVSDVWPVWWLPFVAILFLAVYGLVASWASPPDSQRGEAGAAARGGPPRWLVLSLGIIGVLGLLLAVGAASDLTRPLFEWLYGHIPFFRGFRDSQKFVALLCLAYACLGGLGVDALARWVPRQGRRLPRAAMTALLVAALCTPLAYTFTMFGTYGQLGATDYPEEWYQVNEYLNCDEGDYNVLFLPWHLYMDYEWLPNRDQRLANPAHQFFDRPVIAGDNIEIPGVPSQSDDPVSAYVELLLARGGQLHNMGELLAPLNVKYVVLVHEVDYQGYQFLYHQDDLSVAMQRPGLTLFRNEHPVSRAYGVDSVVYVDGLEEYLALSQEQDVTGHLYLLGEGTGDDGNGTMQALAVEGGPTSYRVGDVATRYVVLTVPQGVSTEHWEAGGSHSLGNVGFVPAFEVEGTSTEIAYTRFYRVYLPSYIVSLFSLACVASYCTLHTLRRRRGRPRPDGGLFPRLPV
ncbi:MAG: hypothetical protein SV910_02160 [Chloroflexota bacterium]|nr:hypothetical protein [Chloroflexota bacterium]